MCIAIGAILIALSRSHMTPSHAGPMRYVGLLILAFVTMAFCEGAFFRVHRFQFDFSQRRPLGQQAHRDVVRRLTALLATLGITWALYWVFAEYGLRFTWALQPHFDESWYSPFFRFFAPVTVVLPVAAVPYFYLCEMFGKWTREDDELLKLGRGYLALVRLRSPEHDFYPALRALGVKLFFIPVMTVFFVKNAQIAEGALSHLVAHPWTWDTAAGLRLFDAMYEVFYLVDIGLALLGYVCCFRILDTHIRSAEPTLFGWAVALACYPPFNARITGTYLPHDSQCQAWQGILAAWPFLSWVVGALILAMIWVYLYATIAFGFRFSNLTHRGIIRRGPYAWVRHPAYAAKNLSWWLISLPFLTGPAACIRLLLLNTLYVARALTEERHLSRDPVYCEYMKKVKWRFIPGVI